MKKYVAAVLVAGILSLGGTVPTARAAKDTTWRCIAIQVEPSIIIIIRTLDAKEEVKEFKKTWHARGLNVKCVKLDA